MNNLIVLNSILNSFLNRYLDREKDIYKGEKGDYIPLLDPQAGQFNPLYRLLVIPLNNPLTSKRLNQHFIFFRRFVKNVITPYNPPFKGD